MPPVEDHDVHEKVKISLDKPYGCHSRKGFATHYSAPNRKYREDGSFSLTRKKIKHVMSKQCRSFYLWDTDPRCSGCTADKDVEYRDRMTAL